MAHGVVAAFFLGAVFIPNAVLSQKTGYALNQGLPILSSIDMGIRDDSTGPGWYNETSKINYRNAGFDSKAATEISYYFIKGRITDFKANPEATKDFFVRKIKSIWNEPTFQCSWILRDSETEVPHVVGRLISSVSGGIAFKVLKCFQMITWLGTIFVLIMRFHKKENKEVVLPMIFVGGFLLEIIWEAKAQYAMIFFALLIPFVIAGLGNILSSKSRETN